MQFFEGEKRDFSGLFSGVQKHILYGDSFFVTKTVAPGSATSLRLEYTVFNNSLETSVYLSVRSRSRRERRRLPSHRTRCVVAKDYCIILIHSCLEGQRDGS